MDMDNRGALTVGAEGGVGAEEEQWAVGGELKQL